MMGGWFLSTSLGGKVAGVMASFWDKIPDKKVFFRDHYCCGNTWRIIDLLQNKIFGTNNKR
jgi:hypothetical protein